MSNSYLAHIVFFLLSIFFISFFTLSCSIKNIGNIICPKIEYQSLLSFKQSLKDPYNQLSSWDAEVINCCKWNGVVCNNLTGHVDELHVHGVSGNINPSFFNLKHLRYLDFSRNSFDETIPFAIGSLTNLEYLNVSRAGFHGKIPYTIGNLSNLHVLAMKGDVSDASGSSRSLLEVDNLEWLLGLSRLEYLNMNAVNLSKVTNWAQVINALPSLVELHCRFCSLEFTISPSYTNSTSLELLDLSFNYAVSFPAIQWIFRLSELLFLDLSWNFFYGPIPTVSNATKLQYVDFNTNNFNSSIPDWVYLCKDLEVASLGRNFLEGRISNDIANLTSLSALDLVQNELSGKIPREIGNFCKIKRLYLSFNNFQGEISDSFGNMSECFLGALEILGLKSNQLSGHLTEQFGEFKSLQMLSLSNNTLSGVVPTNLGKLSSLRILSLASNNFTGNLPISLGQLFSLEELYIDENMLEGVVSESHFVNLKRLQTFSASGNHLTLQVSPNWIAPFQLSTLKLGSWNLDIGSEIPSWMKMQRNIGELDLSNTGISGSVPNWFWEFQFLNLSHNHLHGKIPRIGGPEKEGSQYIYLGSNQFSGSLPQIGDIVKELDLSNNSFSGDISHFLCDTTSETYGLEILHLGGNRLTGELPDCWMKWPSLRFLSLGNNEFFGSIPSSIGFLTDLRSLNFYRNRFSGKMPFSMQNCTKLIKIDLAYNNLDGTLPPWIGTSLSSLRILILRSNKLSGTIFPEICHLSTLQILDLSDNRFSHRIPRCVYNFTAMATKRSLPGYNFGKSDYSYSLYTWGIVESATVAIKGSELQYDTILPLVNLIDLSKNNLSGDIPEELASLVELRSLNLSDNHLTGSIPSSIGDLKQLESLDLSRNTLSGQVPSSFTHMTSLNHLNLSYNNLTGKIPESTQILSLDASSFIGNNLCGPPLTSNCSYDGHEVREHKDKDEDEDESTIKWLYVFLSLGYAFGFSIVCTILVLKKSWSAACFAFLECMWDKFYVCVSIKWRRLNHP